MQTTRFHISEIASCTGTSPVTNRNDDAAITTLLTDSRQLADAAGCLFVALESTRNDGHRYIEDLYRRGVRHFLVRYIPENVKNVPDTDFLVTENPLRAMQQLAAAHRRRFTIPVIGITGSNGKTIVKEWLCYLMSEDRQVVCSPKSYNSQTGVPLSVWEMLPRHEVAVFEAGISQTGEMERLEQIIRPTIGIFTNIGTAHDAHFQNRAQKITEKLQLFAHADTLIYSLDDAMPAAAIARDNRLTHLAKFTWGHSPEAALQLLSVTTQGNLTTLEACYNGEKITTAIPFPDRASVENAMHCWACLLAMSFPADTIARRMRTLPAIEMRMELKEAINNCSVINDSYSSDYSSLQIAVDFLNRQQQHAKKTVILSDMLQSGLSEEVLYTDIAHLLATKNIHRIIGIGAVISQQAGRFTMAEKSFYPDTAAFLRDFSRMEFRDETILLKGARLFAFEQIDKVLQQKAHETVLAINLNALAHNLNYFRSKLAPNVRIMAMVKAFSYGSGSFEIAGLLQFHQTDYLTVAYADEGVELRRAGIRLPVMVMSPEEQSLDKMLAYDLEPEIYSFRVWDMLKEKLRLRSRQPPVHIHLKLDTGMRRLGFEEADIPRLLRELAQWQPAVKVASVFSHLAGSDDPSLDWFTKQQLAAFRRMSAQITAACPYKVLRHLLNSAGIVRFPEAQFDMVRLGIGLYGVGMDAAEQQQLQTVGTLKTVISQIKQIKAGESVGYNRRHIAGLDSCVATLPIGYADGLNRKFGNGRGQVLVNGTPAAVVGNVCMDMCMVDITGIAAREGDEVIIFGDAHPIREVARALDTIPYEVLTSVSRRVKRVYYQE